MNNNLSTIQKVYENFQSGNIPGIIDQLADDVAWEQWADNTAQKAGVPWMQEKKGKDGAVEFFRYIGENLEIKEFTVIDLMANDNQVAAEFILEAVYKTNGKAYRDEEMHLWSFNAEGKVSRLRHYTDTAKHMAAAGLSGK